MNAPIAQLHVHRDAQPLVRELPNQVDALVVPALVPGSAAVDVLAVTRLVKALAILQVVNQDVQKNALLHVGEYVLAAVVTCVVPIAKDFVRMNVEVIAVIRVVLQHVVIVVQVVVTDLVQEHVQDNAGQPVVEVAMRNV